jgi:hypothetical protein
VPVILNGRSLGVARNGIFTEANTDPIPGGRLWTEAAAAWNAARAAALLDAVPAAEFMPAGPASSARTYAQQVALKSYWVSQGHPEKAATPGTSNHGYAIAVDILGPRAQAWMLIHGLKFGWSHDEGLRVNEVWHYRYIGGYKKPRINPFTGYPADERRWIREYDSLLKRRRDPHRRAVLRRVMIERRKLIWASAQKGGWGVRKRRKRYHSLLARTR